MHIRIIDVLNIVAILLGPIVALTIQRWSDDRRQALGRKHQIFKTLMMYRASRLSRQYVEALNLIDVEFAGKREDDKQVREAWKVLLDHFNERQKGTEALERANTYTANLLVAMGRRLGYDFNVVQIKRDGYLPQAHVNLEEEQQVLRKSVIDLLDGKRKIPVIVFEQHFKEIRPPEGKH
jgi:hypothetical protein